MDDATEQLEGLITALASEDMQRGHRWYYDGERLYDDEVGHLSLPCALCAADDLARRLVYAPLGFEFRLGPTERPGFPLAFTRAPGVRTGPYEAACLIRLVFETEMKACRSNLALLFGLAARVVRPDFDLLPWTRSAAGGSAYAHMVQGTASLQ